MWIQEESEEIFGRAREGGRGVGGE